MNSHNVITKDDEIDLLSLLSTVLSTIKKNIYIIAAILILSTLTGYLLYQRASPYYKARLIADSGILPNTEIINIIDYWQSILNKGDYVTLAAKLNLSVDAVKKINLLKAEDTSPDNTGQASEKNENSFMLRAEVSDVQILDSLEYAIVYALENNEYIKKRSVIRRQNLQALKNRISGEIANLDSIKTSVKDLLNSNRSASGNFLTSPSEVNVQIVALYEKILELETALKLGEDIHIIENFTKTTKPDGPYIRPFLLYGLIIGCLLSALWVVIVLVNKKFKTL